MVGLGLRACVFPPGTVSLGRLPAGRGSFQQGTDCCFPGGSPTQHHASGMTATDLNRRAPGRTPTGVWKPGLPAWSGVGQLGMGQGSGPPQGNAELHSVFEFHLYKGRWCKQLFRGRNSCLLALQSCSARVLSGRAHLHNRGVRCQAPVSPTVLGCGSVWSNETMKSFIY